MQRSTALSAVLRHLAVILHKPDNECYNCNLHKGPNLAGRDPRTRRIVRLYHPRCHKWDRHFRWEGALLVGRTAIGRTTISTLSINLVHRVELREALLDEGLFRF